MQDQWLLGSESHIAFDECTAYPSTHKYAGKAMERTHRWATRSVAEHAAQWAGYKKKHLPYQALYAVVQGGVYEDLRKASAKFIVGLDTDGIAIGGVSVGETKEEMRNVLGWIAPFLPENKPRHLLGVGEIDDIFVLVEHGMDTFDCVQPTRLARMGRLYTYPTETQQAGMLDITRAEYAQDTGPVDTVCDCVTCSTYSRAYLRHLFHVRELLGYRLATLHNIHVINRLVRDIRLALRDNTFLELKKRWVYNER